jgi:F0F1-type ATP synthase delta subunit
MELGRNPDEDPDIQKSAKIIEDYQLKYTELVINLENIYIAQVKLDLAPDKNQQKELESMINSARYLAAQVEDTLESNLD